MPEPSPQRVAAMPYSVARTIQQSRFPVCACDSFQLRPTVDPSMSKSRARAGTTSGVLRTGTFGPIAYRHRLSGERSLEFLSAGRMTFARVATDTRSADSDTGTLMDLETQFGTIDIYL